jgi:hypothetical protein
MLLCYAVPTYKTHKRAQASHVSLEQPDNVFLGMVDGMGVPSKLVIQTIKQGLENA